MTKIVKKFIFRKMAILLFTFQLKIAKTFFKLMDPDKNYFTSTLEMSIFMDIIILIKTYQ